MTHCHIQLTMRDRRDGSLAMMMDGWLMEKATALLMQYEATGRAERWHELLEPPDPQPPSPTCMRSPRTWWSTASCWS